MKRVASCTMLTLCVTTVAVAASQVVLRGAAEPLDAPVTELSLAGVHVGGAGERVIGWDSVKVIVGDLASEAEAYEALSDEAWRARIRLARGDVALALPLFESLYDQLRATPGPTGLMVTEGLLRCRLRRGAQISAIGPWLESLAMRNDGLKVAGDPELTPVIDPDSLLCPALPPMFVAEPAVLAAAAAETSAAGGDETADFMRAWYDAAIAHEAGVNVDLDALPSDGGAPSRAFVRQIVLSRIGDESARRTAREQLEAGLRIDIGGWGEAWRRVALGRSLLRESDPDLRMRGVLHLLHLPARFGTTQPHLTGLALAEAALELDRRNDHAGARSLRDELRRLDADHPALLWLDVQLNKTASDAISWRPA